MRGCYRCGAIDGPVEVKNNEEPVILTCGECGEENTIVTFQVALDLLNEKHFHDRMRGGLVYEKSVDDVDEFLESIGE
jgi:hypothetical protein